MQVFISCAGDSQLCRCFSVHRCSGVEARFIGVQVLRLVLDTCGCMDCILGDIYDLYGCMDWIPDDTCGFVRI